MTCCETCGQTLPVQGLDFTQRTLRVGAETRMMTTLEWQLLARLYQSEGRYVSTEQLLQHMWRGTKEGGTVNTLRAYVTRMRHRLAGTGYVITNRFGFGYMLEKTS